MTQKTPMDEDRPKPTKEPKHKHKHNRKRKKTKKRHPLSHAREVALQGLYQFELGAQSKDTVLRFPWLNEPLDAQKGDFASRLLLYTIENKGALDVAIHAHSHIHRSQLSTIVRSLIRMAITELQLLGTPVAVVLDEYIELVRKYDGEESVPYINGVLDSYCRESGLSTDISTKENVSKSEGPKKTQRQDPAPPSPPIDEESSIEPQEEPL